MVLPTGLEPVRPLASGFLVLETGIEPATKCLKSLRSANELLEQVHIVYLFQHGSILGRRDRGGCTGGLNFGGPHYG